jgi:sugar-specific transcriptional regulator TrmB
MSTDAFPDISIDKRSYRIYKTLLEIGPAAIRQIAEKSGVNRGTTHEILKKLVRRNLASYHPKGKTFHYQAEPPERLLELTKKKQKNLRQLSQQLEESIIPNLLETKALSTKPTVSYYEDSHGVEKVLKDVLATMQKTKNKKYYVFSTKPMRNYLYLYFPNFTKQRVKGGIFVKVIALGEGGIPAPLSERRWLGNQTLKDFLSYVIIYSDKLALISLTKDDVPYSVVIKEAGISNTLKFIFNSLWKQLSSDA